MASLRVGFLGCGLIGRSHAAGLSSVKQAEIVSVFDPDGKRAARFAADFCPSVGLDAVASSAEAVIETVDVVYVCTWTSEHRRLVELAASAQKAVFCEKPLATSLDDAVAMQKAVAKAGVTNQVGLVLRHSPAFRWLQQQIVQADVGRLMSIVFRDDQYIPTQGLYDSTWRGDIDKAGGGTLLEHSIHDLDLLEWMMGPISEVTARMDSIHGITGIDDQASVLLIAESGAHASLVSLWHDMLNRPSQRRVEAICQRGFFSLEGDWSGPVRYELADQSGQPISQGKLGDGQLETAAAGVDGITSSPDAGFIAAVIENRPAYPDFGTALQAHRLADAAYRSAEAGGLAIQTPPIVLQMP